MGFSQVPLLCAREVPVPGALPRVIRVLMHYYAPDNHVARHVYLVRRGRCAWTSTGRSEGRGARLTQGEWIVLLAGLAAASPTCCGCPGTTSKLGGSLDQPAR